MRNRCAVVQYQHNRHQHHLSSSASIDLSFKASVASKQHPPLTQARWSEQQHYQQHLEVIDNEEDDDTGKVELIANNSILTFTFTC